MDAREAAQQKLRIEKFTRLDSARYSIYATRKKMNEKSGEEGTVRSHSSPFTGNTRESRNIVSLKISFSPTCGGEPPRELELTDLHIPAWALGDAIEKLLSTRLAQLNAEIEKL